MKFQEVFELIYDKYETKEQSEVSEMIAFEDWEPEIDEDWELEGINEKNSKILKDLNLKKGNMLICKTSYRSSHDCDSPREMRICLFDRRYKHDNINTAFNDSIIIYNPKSNNFVCTFICFVTKINH
jgi:hypothetical protein